MLFQIYNWKFLTICIVVGLLTDEANCLRNSVKSIYSRRVPLPFDFYIPPGKHWPPPPYTAESRRTASSHALNWPLKPIFTIPNEGVKIRSVYNSTRSSIFPRQVNSFTSKTGDIQPLRLSRGVRNYEKPLRLPTFSNSITNTWIGQPFQSRMSRSLKVPLYRNSPIDERNFGGSNVFRFPTAYTPKNYMSNSKFEINHKMVKNELSEQLLDLVLCILQDELRREDMIPEHYKILKEMSKLKAKEHVLKERKEIVAHKMAAARNEFLRSVVHQRQKMRSAEEAKMATRDAYRGVDSLQQEVANEERDIHILQEEEQGLCQELLAAEARVADNDQDSLSTQRKRSYANYLYVPF